MPEINFIRPAETSTAIAKRMRDWNTQRIQRAEQEAEAKRRETSNLLESLTLEVPTNPKADLITPTVEKIELQQAGWFQPLITRIDNSSNPSIEIETLDETIPTVKGVKVVKDSLVRDAIRKALNKRKVKLDNDTIEALLIHTGAESGYNHLAQNPTSSAYGLGQWIKANHADIIDHINKTKNKNYTSIQDLDLDDLAEALAYWYYDQHKSGLDKQQGVFNKVKYLAKVGLGPGILSGANKNYKDVDEDWLKYFHKTGHDAKNKFSTFDQHIEDRILRAGYLVI